MSNRLSGLIVAATLMGAPATAQELPSGYLDPGPILRAASEAIGVANLRCVAVSGSAYAGMVGQQRLNGYEVDWPRGRPLTNYTRTMNWDAGTMVEEFDREPGNNPASWKHGLGWRGGDAHPTEYSPTLRDQRRVWVAHRWARERPGSRTTRGGGAVAARHVAQPPRLPQGGNETRSQSQGDVAVGAGGDGSGRARPPCQRE